MRIAAIILNLLLLGTTVLMLGMHGMPEGEGKLFFWLVLITPAINILYLWKLLKSDDLLSLYLRRKCLEEQTKIEKLKTPK